MSNTFKNVWLAYMELNNSVENKFKIQGLPIELVFIEKPGGECWIEASYNMVKKARLKPKDTVTELEKSVWRFVGVARKRMYSFRASGGGNRVNGRILASNMSDATEQALKIIEGYGVMSVDISELRDQSKAIKEWLARGH